MADKPEKAAAVSLADKKRIKHREYVKKSYNKKISTIESLRNELDSLEQQYASLLTGKSPNSSPIDTQSMVPYASSSTSLDVETLEPHTHLLQKYLAMTDTKNQLRRENDELYQISAGHMKIEGRVHQLLNTEAQFPTVALPYRIRPLPDAEYSKVIVDTRDDILRFMYAPGKLSTGASVFGWTDQRKVQGEELKFALEKHFVNISAYDLLQRSWGIFSSTENFPKIYTPSLNVEFHELQRVNEETMLLYRTIKADGSELNVKTVFLLARLKIDEGYMLLFRSIDKDLVHFKEDEINQVIEETRALLTTQQLRKEIWVEKYIWVLFKDVGPESCIFHFGGSTTTTIWLKEVLFIALRWEMMAVGPQITLTM
uniref:BZIP domain-containing protein n=1 Tax=Globisporangium ultimum (strain ATCC 200006 / CBS 805.95 / DAOM BR144) TaxID=431595 RepID=K3WNQ8_GLOUD